jgi:hypothetical protein
MTAPSRRNGTPVRLIEHGCERKVRYSDEFGARAAGQLLEEQNKIKLWLYPCPICKGWHLTKKHHSRAWMAVSYQFERSQQARFKPQASEQPQ